MSTKKRSHPAKVDWNADASVIGDSKLEVRFKEDGFIRAGKGQFQDETELVSHLSAAFPVMSVGEDISGSIKRVGKYVRLDERGAPCFTFGDPILDLITDRLGSIRIGDLRHNLAPQDVGDPSSRNGGISTINLALVPELGKQHLLHALLGLGDSVLLHCDGDDIRMVSRNPHHRLNFYRGDGDHMRFRAWRKNYFFYWSIGAEIETWGKNFRSARIESKYGQAYEGTPTCATIKLDADEDTNDNYLDEYEWGVSVAKKPVSKPPSGVESLCTADWARSRYEGLVTKGCSSFWI